MYIYMTRRHSTGKVPWARLGFVIAGPNSLMLTRRALGVGVKFRVILLMLILIATGWEH